MSAGLGTVVRAGVGRRRVQTVVIALTTLLAVAASVLATGLLVASRAPFEQAFTRQHGAHLAGQFDAAKATADQVAATAHATGVTATAGPFATVELRPRSVTGRGPSGTGPGVPPGVDLPSVTVVGRGDAGGDVDRPQLTEGHWASGPGEIVWAVGQIPFRVGDRIAFPGAPGSPTLTVVGLARSATKTAQAWASPATVTALTGPGAATGYQMLYRLAAADTDADINAARAAVAAAVPPEALAGAASYLQIKRASEQVSGTFVPFVVAFGVLGLVMSVLIIGIVVSGAVGAATRRIGVLKSLGYTPAQVARAYVAQALIPATAGAAAGVVLGNLAAVPVLAEEGEAFGTGTASLAPWVSVVVPLAALAAVAVTALVPALRAGRLRTVEAIVAAVALGPL
ncbi:FtsX-like permease family protein, partial [Dactylosporangium fulvum]|uniref:FtsX-like permease family protein n=1 Tax=Dactylosporangium fulvum TaxID=53359 RepID=UPI0031DD7F97